MQIKLVFAPQIIFEGTFVTVVIKAGPNLRKNHNCNLAFVVHISEFDEQITGVITLIHSCSFTRSMIIIAFLKS